MKNTLIVIGILATVGITSCNKTNSFSKRLSGETWKVTSLTIAGESEEADHLPELSFSDCDIYDEVCMGEWHIEDDHAEFAWQFDEKGSKFSIANQSVAEQDHDHDHGDGEEEEEHVEPIDQCQALSGTYDVGEMKRKTMKITSSNTIGHSGEEVVIELELQ